MTSRTTQAALLIALTTNMFGCNDPTIQDVLGLKPYFVKLEKEPAQVAKTVSDLADEFGFEPLHIYDNATQGFAVWLRPELASEIERIPEVRYVKRDRRDRVVPPEEQPPPEEEVIEDPGPELGDDEIPPSIARVGGPFLGSADFSNCHVAVIDTGIDAAHPDLNVVASLDVVGVSTPTDAAPDADPNGHGTHVAGTVGALASGDGVYALNATMFVIPRTFRICEGPIHLITICGDPPWLLQQESTRLAPKIEGTSVE